MENPTKSAPIFSNNQPPIKLDGGEVAIAFDSNGNPWMFRSDGSCTAVKPR